MKTGILLTNLGTPAAPTTKAVRKYLAEFLWDPRVVEIPRPVWWLILHGIVLRVRPKKSAKLYQAIWMEEGSPLLIYSQRLAENLQIKLNASHGLSDRDETHTVRLGMRYGQPSIENALNELRDHKVDRVIVLPLYPQYSAATTASTFDAIAKTLKKWRYIPQIKFIQQYFNHPEYITAVANSIAEQKRSNSHLVFSFHGLPKRCVDLGDPYQQQSHATAELIAAKLRLSKKDYSVVFQSRFGAAEWLKPYCDETLRSMPKQGIKDVTLVCPGFAVDCLETLEEIAQQNRETFLEAGGEKFSYIPALNDAQQHTELLVSLINNEIKF